MFTTGSKLFIGATVLSIVAAIVYGVTVGGWLGTVALISVSAGFALLTGINFFIHDGNVPAMQPGATTDAAAAQQPVGRSLWPLAAALGAGLIVVGAETRPIVLIIGVALVLAAGAEWVVQAWSERASGDAAYNDEVRDRLAYPLEFPIFAAAGLGLIIYSFSRIMLWIDKDGGPVIFVVVGTLVLTGGFILASRPSLKRSLVTGVCVIGALGLVSTGAVMAVDGQREIHEYPTTESDEAVCDEEGEAPGEAAEIDDRASQNVAATSNLAITVELRDGTLTATELGIPGERDTVTIARSNPTNILFVNHDDPARRFTVRKGSFTTTENDITSTVHHVECTQLVDEGGEQMLTIEFDKPSIASEEPYAIEVPGVEGQHIVIVVP